MKSKQHTFVVTASFNIPLDGKRARYFFQKLVEGPMSIAVEHARPKSIAVRLIKGRVKELGRVVGSLKRKDR